MRLDVLKWRSFARNVDVRDAGRWHHYMAAARAIIDRFGIACDHIAGHGDIQTDRASFEGATLRDAIKAECGGLFAMQH